MVADDLAHMLAQTYVQNGASLLDPFCGSGRILMAAPHAGRRVGLDVNPLAWLLTSAKFARAKASKLNLIARDLAFIGKFQSDLRIESAINGGVEWFSPNVVGALERLVMHLNGLCLDEPELLVVGAALSATVRKTSFARQNGWKLHRRNLEDRESLDLDPIKIFIRRLLYCQNIIEHSRFGNSQDSVNIFDSKNLIDSNSEYRGMFDVVITSPPYGDSRTTVQYGAASSLCLSVVSHLQGLSHLNTKGSEIDRNCLGGKPAIHHFYDATAISAFWAGNSGTKMFSLVERFVDDYCASLRGIFHALKSCGRAILVVGRRTVGGSILALDDLSVDIAVQSGFKLSESFTRPFERKRLPRRVNRYARAADDTARSNGLIATMNEEIVLVFDRPSSC